MDIKDFEKQLETINNEITLHFLNAKTKAEESSEKIYKMLDGSLDIKKSVLDIMEDELERVISAYLTELNQIEANIQSLELNIHNLTDLEAQEKVLNREIEDNMKPYIASQKKKKAELAQKISAFKRELANYHKDNNFRLIEEEKNFLFRESELERRLNIDLKRESDANIRDYSDYEKNLLETNDERQINALKEKIKAIRIVGIKDFRKIQDQYAYSFFENRFGYQKFTEKIILENSLKSEEIKVQVQTLEAEKEKLDQEENYERQILEFNKLQILLESERDNSLQENQTQLEKQLQTIIFNNQIIKIKVESEEKKILQSNEIRKEAYEFDLSQLETYQPIGGVFSQQLCENIQKLMNSLVASINLYKDTLITMLQEFIEKVKTAHDRFKNLLLLEVRGNIPKDGPDFKDLVIQITKMTEINFRTEKEMFQKLSQTLMVEINEIIYRIKNIQALLSNFQAEIKLNEENYFSNYKQLIHEGYKKVDIVQTAYDRNFAALEGRKLKKVEIEAERQAKLERIKINKEYSKKAKRLKEKIASFQLEYKTTTLKQEARDKEYIKNSKKRMQVLKRNFSETISSYEKELYSEYQKELEVNLLEEKEKISEL